MRDKRGFATPLLVAAALGATLVPGASAGAGKAGLAGLPKPVDKQSWVLPEDMRWKDYRPLPGINWIDDERQPPRKLRAALILGDFQDRKFVVTRPEGSDEAGNPQGVGSVPTEKVADWYKRFLITKPQKLNHHHSVNEYWLEDSYGLIGIDADAFGPYTVEGKEHEYGLGGGDAGGGSDQCPSGDECGKDFDTEILELSTADVAAATVTNGSDYDFRFILHAGYDESGTWQEFGEMRFDSKESVSNRFGNPDDTKPNWADTRYVDWTSFWAAKGIWSHALPGALSTQGENDGASTYAHEFSHILGVLDNYNNPYGDPVRRSYSGPWDMMSRGTFNGPGGPHNRWQVPGTLGGTMGSHHMLRNKIRMGFTRPDEVTVIQRDSLAIAGPVFADIVARAVPLGPDYPWTGVRGLQIVMDNDDSPDCSVEEDHRCDGGGYDNYTVEVVDRLGYDSFTPDHGVLIAKTKNADSSPFIWVIDSHPKDIKVVDFTRPDGTKAMVSLGDYRQLADALFHAGNGRGVVSEYQDEANALHFYVLRKVPQEGVLSYRVAVRSTVSGGPFIRALSLKTSDAMHASPGRVARYDFTVTNEGNGVDLVRLKPKVDVGWKTFTPYSVIEVPPGESVEVPVFVVIPSGASSDGRLTLTTTSEMNAAAKVKASLRVKLII